MSEAGFNPAFSAYAIALLDGLECIKNGVGAELPQYDSLGCQILAAP